MFYPLDIFKTYSDGSVMWRGAAETFIAAKAYIKELAASSPGEYLVLDQSTGSRVLVTPGGRRANTIVKIRKLSRTTEYSPWKQPL